MNARTFYGIILISLLQSISIAQSFKEKDVKWGTEWKGVKIGLVFDEKLLVSKDSSELISAQIIIQNHSQSSFCINEDGPERGLVIYHVTGNDAPSSLSQREAFSEKPGRKSSSISWAGKTMEFGVALRKSFLLEALKKGPVVLAYDYYPTSDGKPFLLAWTQPIFLGNP